MILGHAVCVLTELKMSTSSSFFFNFNQLAASLGDCLGRSFTA